MRTLLALSFGLLISALLLGSAEAVLRFLPDEALPAGSLEVPPLVREDQVNIIYRRNGFRGKRPCRNCPEDLVRIVTLGGSSTMGVPMVYAGRTYSAVLQRLLDERRPGEHYEVLNAGVAGYGITQVYAALKEELLQYQPDIVTICSWFNDTAPIPGWYSIPGMSDWEAYEHTRRLQRIQSMAGVQLVRESRLYGLFRYTLLSARASALGRATPTAEKQRPRMDHVEFRQVLEKIVALSEEHNFLPVLITEPKDRTADFAVEAGKNPYLQILAETADKYQLPLIDTLTPLSEIREEWLFYDFIHPNPKGHEIIAEAIYDGLFDKDQPARARTFWEERGIDLSRPEAVSKARLQFETGKMPAEVILQARAPYLAAEASASLIITGAGKERLRFPDLSSDFKTFPISFDDKRNLPPITDLEFSMEFDSVTPIPINGSELLTPVPLSIKSGGKDYGWTVEISVNGVRQDRNRRGYNAVLIDGKSGKVLAADSFDILGSRKENERLAAFVQAAEAYVTEAGAPLIVLSVHTDGRHNADAKLLKEVFQRIGGSGELPEAFESFVLIGSPGAPAGSAFEKMGPQLIDLKFGELDASRRRLIEIRLEPQPGLLRIDSGGVSLLTKSERLSARND